MASFKHIPGAIVGSGAWSLFPTQSQTSWASKRI